VTPEERSERARKAARARWALGATEKRRVRALYYYRRIERAIRSGDVRWLEADQRERLVQGFRGPLPGGGTWYSVRTETEVPGASQGNHGDPGGGNCDQARSGDYARADAQTGIPRSGTNARKHATARITRRITRRVPR
jgi:hypothetical protein